MVSLSGCCSTICVVVLAVLAAPVYYALFPSRVYDIKGKCAIVTGASDGIGVNIATELAKEGVVKMVIAARRLEKLEAVRDKVMAAYPNTDVKPIRLDVGDKQSRDQFVAKVTQEVGPCEILVNNAAIETNDYFATQPEETWEAIWRINVHGLMHLSQAFMPGMLKAGQGHIVNIASLAGHSAIPYNVLYSTTKHAVVGFSHSLRTEMMLEKKPISVHVVCPGFITQTGMAANNFASTGEDMAEATKILGSSSPDENAKAVVNSIFFDEPDVTVNFPPVRPLLALNILFPRFPDLLYREAGLTGMDKVVHYLKLTADKKR
eukprot:TRINITY_DN37801_c0_g1_i1.p1 TRINITY_DN37801_c0_g1~~TRINITY_DN37801_c0_g1_i1.p1  ORF type:complete len:347 (+),score=48.81 TRINITY_DN37801_c0_g1_i1:84-1043(+)